MKKSSIDNPRPTIRDVARRADTSTQTVSRVANGSPHVASQTRERVLAAMKELDYEANHLARALVTRSTHMIGIVAYDMANPYFGQLVRSIEDAAFSRGYNVLIGNTDADLQRELAYLHVFTRRRVDGILASASSITKESFEAWSRVSCPVVFLEDFFANNACSFVTANNREAAREAVEHLLSLGHRRVAMLAAPLTGNVAVRDRFMGYLDALSSYGVPRDPSLVGSCEEQTEEGAYRAMNALLQAGEAPTAVFCQNDTGAIGAMRCILDAGLEIPKDISVVGFDDVPVASMLRVPLTTVRLPIQETGSAAVQLLLERIEGGPAIPPRKIVLQARLIVRQSTARPSR